MRVLFKGSFALPIHVFALWVSFSPSMLSMLSPLEGVLCQLVVLLLFRLLATNLVLLIVAVLVAIHARQKTRADERNSEVIDVQGELPCHWVPPSYVESIEMKVSVI